MRKTEISAFRRRRKVQAAAAVPARSSSLLFYLVAPEANFIFERAIANWSPVMGTIKGLWLFAAILIVGALATSTAPLSVYQPSTTPKSRWGECVAISDTYSLWCASNVTTGPDKGGCKIATIPSDPSTLFTASSVMRIGRADEVCRSVCSKMLIEFCRNMVKVVPCLAPYSLLGHQPLSLREVDWVLHIFIIKR